MKNRVSGFTLLQLMVVMTSVSMLVAVLSAPVSVFDNHRAAALSIARTQELLDVAYQFALINGEWPVSEDGSGDTVCDSASATSNTSDNIGFFDVFLSSGKQLTNAWGRDLIFICDVDSANYIVEQTVPDEWADYMANSLDKTVVGGSSGGETTLQSILDRYGNRSFFQFQMSTGDDGGGSGGGGSYEWQWKCFWIFCAWVYVEVDSGDEDEDGDGDGDEEKFYSVDVPKPTCVNGLRPAYAVTSSLMCGAKTVKIADDSGSWDNEITGFSTDEMEEGGGFWRFRLQSYLRDCEVTVGEGGVKFYGCPDESTKYLKKCGGNLATLQVLLYCSG